MQTAPVAGLWSEVLHPRFKTVDDAVVGLASERIFAGSEPLTRSEEECLVQDPIFTKERYLNLILERAACAR